MENTSLNKAQKKEYAKMLFLREGYSPKQVADKLEVAETTVSAWAAKEKWESQRKALTASKAEQLAFLYDILAKLTEQGKNALEDDDPKTNPDTDAIEKISKSIERLEKDGGIGNMIQTGIELLKYVQDEDLAAAKVVNKWFYLFIQDKMGMQ
jgi:transcriptional regulator with XRE-family HTH domain